jgi:hypothetical protein
MSKSRTYINKIENVAVSQGPVVVRSMNRHVIPFGGQLDLTQDGLKGWRLNITVQNEIKDLINRKFLKEVKDA